MSKIGLNAISKKKKYFRNIFWIFFKMILSLLRKQTDKFFIVKVKVNLTMGGCEVTHCPFITHI